MRRALRIALAAAAVLAACKRHEGPGLFRDGGGRRPADAAAAKLPADAAPAVAKPVATAIAVGEDASCAVMSDATVRCWGANAAGQLGDGTTRASAVPVAPPLHGVVEVVASRAFACARLDDGSVTCWGAIGFGAQPASARPTAVAGVTRAAHLYAIGGAACAAIADGSLVCWGDVDERGRITDSGAHRAPTAVLGVDRTAPSFGGAAGRAQVPTVDHVIALAARAALLDDGDVVMWPQGAPKRAGITDAREVASAGDLACALRADARVWCVTPPLSCTAAKPKPHAPVRGRRERGHGRVVHRPPARPAPPPPGTPLQVLHLDPAVHLAFDYGPGCVVTTGHAIECIDPAAPCKPGTSSPVSGVTAVTGSCGLVPGGGVRCWSKPGERAVTIAGVGHVAQLAGRGAQACVLERDHTVTCWTGTGPARPVAFP